MIKTANFTRAFTAGLIAALICLGSALAHAQELTARVDRNKVSVDDTFTLTIRSTAMSIFDSPDLAPLKQDFEVLGNTRSSQHSIINGKTQSSLEWHISLAAKREGALVIPPIEVDGKKTQAIVIEVSKSSFAQNNSGFEPVFVESEIDTNRAYVQSQMLMTVRIFYAVALERGAQLSELEIENAVVKQINEAAYETKIKNMSYQVHEVKYAIFPQRSGTLEIPKQTFSALLANRRRSGSVFDNFGSVRRGRPISAESKTHSVEVLPKAPAYTGKHWLPAGKISLIESWSKDLSELKAGEPVTRSVIVEAIGLQGSQIPPLDLSKIQNAQQYPDQAETADEDTSMGVTGTRIESMAIIPAGGGELTIPEVRLTWWNTNTNTEQVATIPATTLNVAGTPLAKPSQPSNQAIVSANPSTDSSTAISGGALEQPATQSGGNFWPYATAFAVFLWLATIAYFSWFRTAPERETKRERAKPSSKTAYSHLEKLAGSGQPEAVRTALIDWARHHTDRQNISALSSIASYFNDERLTQELHALDEAIYKSGSGSYDAQGLLSALRAAIESQPKATDKRKKNYDLEPLYRA